MGADQPQNAARCAELGVARVLDAARATPDSIRAAVADVLRDPSHRAAANDIADEIAAMPGPEHAVALLDHLAA
jgi:UDP:flavonoid glycosyltransferase YjiC (YdhE family)